MYFVIKVDQNGELVMTCKNSVFKNECLVTLGDGVCVEIGRFLQTPSDEALRKHGISVSSENKIRVRFLVPNEEVVLSVSRGKKVFYRFAFVLPEKIMGKNLSPCVLERVERLKK